MIFGILTFLAIKTCLEPTALDADVLGGVKLKDLAGNWLASWGESIKNQLSHRGGETLQRLRHSLEGASGLIPGTPDISKAECVAFGRALQAFHAALIERKDTFGYHETHWIGCFREFANEIASHKYKKSLSSKYKDWLEVLHRAFQNSTSPNLATAGRSLVPDDVAKVFHNTLYEWLLSKKPEFTVCKDTCAPSLVAEWLIRDSKGFQFSASGNGGLFSKLKKLFVNPPVNRPALQMTMLEAWGQCFLEEIKSNERAFKDHILKCIDDMGTLVPRIAMDVTEANNRVESALASMSVLDRRLRHLLAFSEERFATAMGKLSSLENGLTSLMCLQADELTKLTRDLGESRKELLMAVHEKGGPAFSHNSKDDEVPSTATVEQVGPDDLVYRKRWLRTVVSRDEEMARLLDFLNCDETFSWWVMVGEGGMGKSRLALELVLQARSCGWRAGFLLDDCHLSKLTYLHDWKPSTSTLVVIDYASWQESGLVQALAQMAQNREQFVGCLRVLVLDRPGFLQTILNTASRLHKRSCEIARSNLFPRQTLQASLQSKTEVFDESRDALMLNSLPVHTCRRFLLDVTHQAIGNPAPLPEKWEADIEHFADAGRPLLLTILGIAYVRHTELGQDRQKSMNSLLDDVWKKEIAKWDKELKIVTRESDGEYSTQLGLLQAFAGIATLCRGIDLSKHLDLVGRALGCKLTLNHPVVVAARKLLGKTSTTRLRPLEPALLASRFIVCGGYHLETWENVGLEPPPPFDAAKLVQVAWQIDPAGLRRSLTSLTRDQTADATSIFEAYGDVALRNDSENSPADKSVIIVDSMQHFSLVNDLANMEKWGQYLWVFAEKHKTPDVKRDLVRGALIAIRCYTSTLGWERLEYWIAVLISEVPVMAINEEGRRFLARETADIPALKCKVPFPVFDDLLAVLRGQDIVLPPLPVREHIHALGKV